MSDSDTVYSPIAESWKVYFKYNGITSKTDCNLCHSQIAGNIESNNKRHFVNKHPTLASEMGITIRKRSKNKTDGNEQGPSKKIAKKMSKGEWIRNCIELIAIHLLPFQLLNFRPFRNLTSTHSTSTGTTLNAENIKKYIKLTASEIQEKIKKEVHKKMVSVKLDIGSRYDKSVLGVNIQFYSKQIKKIVIRTLGMIELEGFHTTRDLEREITQLLQVFKIDKRNIYSYTSDNGSNMISLGRLLRSMQHDLALGDEMRAMQENEDSSSESDDEDENAGESNVQSSYRHENILQNMNQVFTILSVIRCACHVLNLAVTSTLKQVEAGTIVNDIRKIVKQFKALKYKRIIKELKIPRPKLDVETRWNSMYMMFSSLLAIKENLDTIYHEFSRDEAASIKVNDEQWRFIETFCDAFKPPYDATKRLQSVQLPMSKKDKFYFKLS